DYNLSTSVALVGMQQMPEAPTPSQELVAAFHQLRFGESQKRIAKSEEKLASDLINRWGLHQAREIVTKAFKKANGAGFKSIYLTGLERYIREEEKRSEKNNQKRQEKG